MYFVALLKFKKKPDKAFMIETQKLTMQNPERVQISCYLLDSREIRCHGGV